MASVAWETTIQVLGSSLWSFSIGWVRKSQVKEACGSIKINIPVVSHRHIDKFQKVRVTRHNGLMRALPLVSRAPVNIGHRLDKA
jgi:hypothetical protein